MANDGFNQNNIDWPLPKSYFTVNLGNGLGNVAFQEVSGLDSEAQVIEYRSGNKAAFSDIKMPGIVKYGNVTLKKGIMPKSQHLFDWFSQIKMNLGKRSTVTICLLDERGQPTMIWT